ncbi:hypothetical protein AUP68_11370 [Ilyonectria robusta]
MSTSVPGLTRPLFQEDLEKSQVVYNRLPDDEDQLAIDKHLRGLQQIFTQYGVENELGIHLIHRHFKLPRHHILLGENFGPPACRWARTVSNSDVDIRHIHGHIFKYTAHGLHPYEYQYGAPPPSVPVAFLSEFTNYIISNGLESAVGLEVLCPEFEGRSMSEIVMTGGQTSMWESTLISEYVPGKTTGWSISNDTRECTPYESHARHKDGSHEPYNVGAPLPETFGHLFQTLRESGCIAEDLTKPARQTNSLVG